MDKGTSFQELRKLCEFWFKNHGMVYVERDLKWLKNSNI